MRYRRHSINKVNRRRGFIALIAVLMLSGGILAMSLSVMSAAALYADSVYRREMRIQKKFDERACKDTIELMKAKDWFLIGEVVLTEFGCKRNI